MVNITFSWDDGSIEDLRLMDLSLKYSIPGMFFIPATNTERSVLSMQNIKIISKNNFEIGAHTYSHSYLTKLSLDKADEELLTGKTYLEQLLGNEVPHFCFPGGKFNSELIELSKKYYKSARTADTGSLIQTNSYLINPTFHFFDRGRKSLIFNGFKNSTSIFRLSLKNFLSSNYFELIKNIIADLSSSNDKNYIIIWGHSWEIERFKLWNKLEDLFQSIRDKYQYNVLRYSDLIKS